MAPNMLGWEMTLKCTDPRPKDKRELLVVFLHWNLVRSGIKCLGTGVQSTINPNQHSSEILPRNWKENEKFSLRYVYDNTLYMFFAMFTDNIAMFNILNRSALEMDSIALDVEETVVKLEGPIETMIPDYEEVMHLIKKNLLEGILHKKTNSTSSQTEHYGDPWYNSASEMIPINAFQAGHDGDIVLYVGRAAHFGSLTPGRVSMEERTCYLAWGGAEHAKTNYQILCGNSYKWVEVNSNFIPPNAFPGGRSETGETLFIGRAEYEGIITIGKVQPSHGVCYIPYNGQEISLINYEILVT